MFSPHDIEAIERATVAAVAPPVVEEVDDWLLCFDDGTVGRAKSAVPLRHEGLGAAVMERIEERYATRGLPAMFRLPQVEGARAVHVALADRGYVEGKPTDVMVAVASDVAASSGVRDVQLHDAPDDAWVATFLGAGFDPVDGASRVRTLRRARGSLHASVKEGDLTIAAGVLALGHGWASIHGMRTALPYRGRGLARSVLATFARTAVERGYTRMALQVEAANPAQSLYARCGFQPAWRYAYWDKPIHK